MSEVNHWPGYKKNDGCQIDVILRRLIGGTEETRGNLKHDSRCVGRYSNLAIRNDVRERVFTNQPTRLALLGSPRNAAVWAQKTTVAGKAHSFSKEVCVCVCARARSKLQQVPVSKFSMLPRRGKISAKP